MRSDPLLDEIIAILKVEHHCHTVILYGSRARGEETSASDYDVVGVKEESGPVLRDSRFHKDMYFDLFVYPQDQFNPTKELLHMRDGVVLIEKEGVGKQFLRGLQELDKAGPERMPDDQLRALQVWTSKSLARIKAGGIDGSFRRMEFVPALLEQYFTTRNEWYLGPKASLRWLNIHEPELYLAFEAAVHPSATLEDFQRLVTLVYPQKPQMLSGLGPSVC